MLVVNVKGMYTSAGALIHGFQTFRPQSGIRGVIFNGATPMLYAGLKQIAHNAGVIPLGFIPHDASLTIESRHLGLVTAGEIADLQKKLDALASLAEQSIDLDQILLLAAQAPRLSAAKPVAKQEARVRIAVALDEAFCFLYQENLALLSALGAELCFFSPVHDAALPEQIQGLYLPGGYPELYAAALSANCSMLSSVKSAVERGLPTIAECGGFLYLHDSLDSQPMVGIIHSKAYKTNKLQRFGYVTLTAQSSNLLCNAGEGIRAHEFHYYESDLPGSDFLAEKPNASRQYACVHATESLYAGFPHLYFPANPAFANNFIRKAFEYAARCHSSLDSAD
ncbi:MAG: cobyrinate a,c-diamide synthase [Eubacteriales bacterium]